MTKKKIKILGISGSLRAGSSASAVLRIVADLVPGYVDFQIYSGLGHIPAFDDSNNLPVPVKGFIQQIMDADAVFFCIPEYAFGVPGALKNSLDWTVSSTAFSDKPVALITAASNGEKAHEALKLTLTAIGSLLSEETKLLISFIKTKLNEKGKMKDQNILISMQRVIDALLQIIEAKRIIVH